MVCKRDNLLKNGLKDGYFRSLSYRLCLLMTMHYVWYWIRCTAQLYYSYASASVIATRWILTNSPRCDGINLCCGVVRSEPRELINIHLIALSSKRLHLKVVFRYQTQVNLTEETVCCFCGNKTVHDCCCFELFYRLELDFLQVSWLKGT